MPWPKLRLMLNYILSILDSISFSSVWCFWFGYGPEGRLEMKEAGKSRGRSMRSAFDVRTKLDAKGKTMMRQETDAEAVPRIGGPTDTQMKWRYEVADVEVRSKHPTCENGQVIMKKRRIR